MARMSDRQIRNAIKELETQREKMRTQTGQLSRTYMADALRWVLGEPGTTTGTALGEED